MAPKKTKEPPPPGGNLVRLELSDEHHRLLRIRAAEANMSMAAYARMIVADAVAGKVAAGKARKQDGR